MPGFSVDTHLLRELGELLVGRDSTALLELIKNAYDADASLVTVEALGLGRPGGVLRVVDDGNGMSEQRFQSAFLRIASRAKETDDRRSPNYRRRYTGQKGIGRLAAHKLAAWLAITSVPRQEGTNGTQALGPASTGVKAVLDWDLIEGQDDLDNLTEGLDVGSIPPLSGVPHGTSLELRRLRTPWNDQQLTTFVTEIRSSQPPPAIVDPTWMAVEPTTKPLVSYPKVRDVRSGLDPGFEIRLTGDFEIGDSLWQRASEDFEWLIEIDATTENVQYQVTPLRRYAATVPEARTYRFQRRVSIVGRPRFQARILTMPNASTRRGPLAGFVRSNSGVRVYLEGFRVLPYGEYGDDWLSIDRDYRSGPRFYKIDIDSESSDQLEVDRREGLQATSNAGYFGAVFLTEESSGGLRSLVNREGFVPDAAYDALVDMVQTGIRLSIRVRRSIFLRVEERKRRQVEAEAERQAAAAKLRAQNEASANEGNGNKGLNVRIENNNSIRVGGGVVPPIDDGDGDGDASPPSEDKTGKESSGNEYSSSDKATGVRPSDALNPPPVPIGAGQIIANAHRAVTTLRASTVPGLDHELVQAVSAGLDTLESELSRLREIQPELRILASVGLQLGAFVHDINGMLGQSRTLRDLLDPFATDETLNRSQAQRIRRVIRALDDLSHTLARQSSYLTDVLVADPRRRRSRVRIADRLDVVRRLLSDEISRLEVTIEDALPADLKTPPMFPAEVGVLLTNLLTNAVKNAGSPGIIRVTGELLGTRGATIFVQNTGTAVDIQDSERWFLPFESTTVEVNEVLGQGLGLGLPITRALIEDYRGTIRFVEPTQRFATSIRVDLPDPQERR